MKAGDLVKTKIDLIGAPEGSLGLALPKCTRYTDEIYAYLFATGKQYCLMKRHLEVINESR